MTRARTLADIGDLSAPLTVTTAAQPNITSVGTLSSVSVSGTSTFGTSGGDTRFNFDGSNQYRITIKNGGNIAGQIGGGGTDDLRFSNAAGSTTMVIKSTNVGIGVASPSRKLELNNGGTGNLVTFTDGVATNFTFKTDGNSVGTFGTEAGSTQLAFMVASNEKVRIDGSGNVAIGLSSGIDGKLHVAGNTVVGDSSTTAFSSFTSGGLDVAVGSGTKAFQVWDDNSTSTPRFIVERGGFVGIGESTPRKVLHITKNDSDGVIILDADGVTTDHQIVFSKDYGTGGTTGGNYWGIGVDGSENRLVFAYDANSQASLAADSKMILDSSGRIYFNTTTNFVGQGNTSTGQMFQTEGTAYFSRASGYSLGLNRNGDGELTNFSRSGSFVGSINVTSSSTSYNTSSDYRLKENVADMTGAIDRVKQLAPKRFNFIVDADTTVDGFLAHEAQAIVPEAVSGTHNEVDDDGNAVMQGIDQAKLVPLLTGALQEAIAKIETLETKVAALEAG